VKISAILVLLGFSRLFSGWLALVETATVGLVGMVRFSQDESPLKAGYTVPANFGEEKVQDASENTPPG